MKRIFNGNARALAMDMSDVHHIAIYGDLIAAKVQGRAASSGLSWHGDRALINIRKKNLNFYLRSSHLLTAIQLYCVCEDHLHNTMWQYSILRALERSVWYF